MSQSSVSRVETGRRKPSRTEVDAWLSATRAGPDAVDRALALLKAVHAETMHWRDLLADTGSLQDQVAEREKAATVVYDWAPEIVPGLLQVRDYTATLLPLFVGPAADVEQMVVGRLQRQRILYEPGREFVLLTTEYALSRPVARPEVMTAQREHLSRQGGLDGVTVGIVPEPHPLLAASGFVLYHDVSDGDPFVTMEMTHGQVVLSDPDDVAVYEGVFDRLRAAARVV